MTFRKPRAHQAMTIFFVGLSAMCSATQWLAAELDHQDGLGAAWIWMANTPVYAPWRILEWWYAYGTFAPRLFASAGMIAVAAGTAGAATILAGLHWRAHFAQAKIGFVRGSHPGRPAIRYTGGGHGHMFRFAPAGHDLSVRRLSALPKTLSPQDTGYQSCWLIVGCVFLPFAFGFFLSHLFRSIMLLLSKPLAAEFSLTPADLGLLTSIYFLSFAAVQLPLGIALDRYGPKRVQIVLLAVATAGAAIFAISESLASLMVGRMLVGLGVAGALMAGLKAIVLWFPSDRLALMNGIFIMLGSLGAVTATAPLEFVLTAFDWRALSGFLAVITALGLLLLLLLVPDRRAAPLDETAPPVSLWAIYTDRRFWRIAPLSGTVIGSACALQGLWAAPWLGDVEGFDQSEIMQRLMFMAMGLPLGAISFGFAAHRLRRFGFGPADILVGAVLLSLAAQLALIVRAPIEPTIAWAIIASLGSGTALSYTSLSETFPKSASARANCALNVLHMGCACAIQAVLGCIIELWPADGGRYPVAAYQVAFGLNLAVQVVALMWFLVSRERVRSVVADRRMSFRLRVDKVVGDVAAAGHQG